MAQCNTDKIPNKLELMSSFTSSKVESGTASCTDGTVAAEGKSCLPSEEELERLAAEEIIRETKSAQSRADTIGSLGWQKRKVKLNQRFVSNTVLRAVKSNKFKYS